ncbi:unnamed protein product [Adineta steineri]|uniref:Uncharacterized protein n=1 Tax=Adineta steineri TaxID=433720 RepID=A0A813X0K8_9BILA|nr:unnamed protein product [Adineta steineri]CAF1203688.1 unnamed protein product [Adineta steineri]CAF3910653.1 unnamed protein product [Adineta steineri]CAF4060660.1 unnamed protein product [Adineta steineri]
MLRSKVEQEVEKKLSEFPVLAPAIATSALASMTTLLQSLPNSDFGGEFRSFIVDPSKLVDTNLTAPVQNVIDGNLTSIPGMEKLKQVAEKDWANVELPQLETPNLDDPTGTIPNVEIGTTIPPTSRILSFDSEDDRHSCPWLHNLLNRFR